MASRPARNLLDRAIAYVAPGWAVQRERARHTLAFAGAWKGARRDRDQTRGWNVRAGDADADTLGDLPLLRDRSRDLVRNSPLAAGAISTKVTSIVGAGLRFNAQIDRDVLGLSPDQAAEWEARAEREWRTWAESPECHLERTLTFAGVQELALRSVLESGDVFVLLPFVQRPGSPYGLKAQIIEADRVSNPDGRPDDDTLVEGVELDPNTGAPVRYHVQIAHPGSDRRFERRWEPVPVFGARTGRRQALHLFRVLRPGQHRGVPDLAPVIEPLKQLDQYTDAELHAAVSTAMFAVFIRTETGQGLGGLNATEYVEQSNQFYKERPVNMKSGTALHLFPDDKVDFANPNRPNTAFDPFTTSVLRQVGVALELPFELLIKHFTASYSAAQAALIEAWKFFQCRRAWLAQELCAPVREALMWEAVTRGRIAAPGFLADPMIRRAWLGGEWIGAPREHIRPDITNKADQLAEDMGWKTRDRNIIERGGDPDQVRRQTERAQDDLPDPDEEDAA